MPRSHFFVLWQYKQSLVVCRSKWNVWQHVSLLELLGTGHGLHSPSIVTVILLGNRSQLLSLWVMNIHISRCEICHCFKSFLVIKYIVVRFVSLTASSVQSSPHTSSGGIGSGPRVFALVLSTFICNPAQHWNCLKMCNKCHREVLSFTKQAASSANCVIFISQLSIWIPVRFQSRLFYRKVSQQATGLDA